MAKESQFTAEGIGRGAHEDTEHFKVTRAFLANPERVLRTLLDSER